MTVCNKGAAKYVLFFFLKLFYFSTVLVSDAPIQQMKSFCILRNGNEKGRS